MSDLETRVQALSDKSLLLLDDDQALRTRLGLAALLVDELSAPLRGGPA